jgi:hypothetical protein
MLYPLSYGSIRLFCHAIILRESHGECQTFARNRSVNLRGHIAIERSYSPNYPIDNTRS